MREVRSQGSGRLARRWIVAGLRAAARFTCSTGLVSCSGAGVGRRERERAWASRTGITTAKGRAASSMRGADRVRPSGSSSSPASCSSCSVSAALPIKSPLVEDGAYSYARHRLGRGLAAAHVGVPARRRCGICSSTCSCCTGPGSMLEEIYGAARVRCFYLLGGVFANCVNLAVHAADSRPPRPALGPAAR